MTQSKPMPDGLDRLQRLFGYLQQDPSNVSLLVDYADLAARLGKAADALNWFESMPPERARTPQALGARGNLLLAAGRPSEAAIVFESLLAECGAEPALQFNLAWARLEEGHFDACLKVLDAIEAAQRATLPLFDLAYAQAAYRVTRFDLAQMALDRFLARQPNDRSALELKALLLLDTGMLDDAEALAMDLVRQREEGWIPQLVLGTVALERHDAMVAETQFRQLLARAPDIGRAWSGRGYASLLRQEWGPAREYFQTAVRHMTDHPGTWQGLAWTCIMLRDLTAARDAVGHALELDRNFADNHGTLAVIEFMEGRKSESELLCRKALRLDPSSASGLYARALLQEAAGNETAASQIIDKILGRLGNTKSFPMARQLASFSGLLGQGSNRPPRLH